MTVAVLNASIIGWMNADATTTVANSSGWFPTGHFTTPQTNRPVLAFDFTSIPSDATVTAASFAMTVNTNFLGTSHTINIYRLKRNWVQNNGSGWINQATYANYRQDLATAWTTAGAGDTTNDRDATAIGSIAVTSTTTGTQTITFTASLVAAWIAGTDPNCGIVMIATDETNTTLIRWNDSSGANPPQLTVTYTPVSRTLLTNLEAYWKMNEASGNLADSSGNAHSLVPTNTPTQTTGIISFAQHYVTTSSQYHSNTDAALKFGNTDWTLTCWCRLTDTNNYYTVVGVEDNGANSGWTLFYHNKTVLDRFVFQMYGTVAGSGDNPVADVICDNGTIPTPTATWMFLAIRHDSVRHVAQIFFNAAAPNACSCHNNATGASIYSYVGTPVAPSTAAFEIGALSGGGTSPSGYMNGDVDEVGMWTRALTNAEILSLYNSGAGLTYPFVGQDTPELRGRPFGLRGQNQLQQLLAQ